MHGWSFGGGRGYPQRFEEQYHCYSVAYADKAHLEVSVKLQLPFHAQFSYRVLVVMLDH